MTECYVCRSYQRSMCIVPFWSVEFVTTDLQEAIDWEQSGVLNREYSTYELRNRPEGQVTKTKEDTSMAEGT